MWSPYMITIVAAGFNRGTCRYCGAPILWVTTASEPGKPSRTLPFSTPRPRPLSVSRNDDTGVVFENWPRASLHSRSCPGPRPSRKRYGGPL